MILLRNTLFAFVVLYLTSAVFGDYPDAGVCTGDCNIHDPSLIQRESDGKWFRFTTHQMLGIASADDISGPWTNIGSVLINQSIIDLPGNDNPWAPDVRYLNGSYWCFYSICKWGSRHASIGVAVSDNMEPGTWTDLGAVGIISLNGDIYTAIDQALIETPEGRLYFSFGSYLQDIFLVELASPTKVIGDLIHIAYNASADHAEEGSYIYYNDGFYYLFFSAGQCCKFNGDSLPAPGNEYKIQVCRSDNVEGPYVDAEGKSCLDGGGTTVYASHDKVYAPGGQGVYKNIIYYHYVDTDYGYTDNLKRFGWNNLDWVDGWPVVV